MFLLSSVLLVFYFPLNTGENYCSPSKTNITCVDCVQTCKDRTCYHCPKDCPESNRCKHVCENCRQGTCKYMNETVPICTEGCDAGFTGTRCQEYCLGECKECDQHTGQCKATSPSSASTDLTTSSMECDQHTGQCNVTSVLPASTDLTSSTICSGPECGDRIYENSLQLSPTSTQSESTQPPNNRKPPLEYIILVFLSALCTGIVCVCYHKYTKTDSCVYCRPCGRDRATIYNTDRSSLTYTGYTYIDETNLGSCHDNPINVPRCSGDNYYEEMGNRLSLGEEDNGSESSLSAWSGTLFGNLFEVDNVSDTNSHLTISEGQLNENENIDIVEVYEMNCLKYIIPEVTIYANQSASDV